MAIIETPKGLDVSFNTMQDLKHGWCPFCEPPDSDIKQTGHHTWECKNCDSTFIYTGQD